MNPCPTWTRPSNAPGRTWRNSRRVSGSKRPASCRNRSGWPACCDIGLVKIILSTYLALGDLLPDERQINRDVNDRGRSGIRAKAILDRANITTPASCFRARVSKLIGLEQRACGVSTAHRIAGVNQRAALKRAMHERSIDELKRA